MRDSHRSHKRQALFIVLLIFLPVAVVGGFNYIIDPLQIYRKQQWVQPRFWDNQRNQNAGKIRSYMSDGSYDSIIMGNSVADNFQGARVAEVLGWKKTMKLTMGGGEASEQAFILEQALENNAIRRLFWCIRIGTFKGEKIDVWHAEEPMPVFLYTKTLLDDNAYLFSMDTFKFSKKMIRGKSKWEPDLDRLNYWQTEQNIIKQVQYNLPSNLKKLGKTNQLSGCKSLPTGNSKLQYPCADYNLLRLIRKYPHVEFVILIAPQTRQSLASRGEKYRSRYFGLQRYLVMQTQNMPNVKIFGFENDDHIVGNLANYRDFIHYHSGVSDQMLRAIASNKNRLTATSIDDYLNRITAKLCNFEIYSDFDTIIPLALPEENKILAKALNERKKVFIQNRHSSKHKPS